MGAICSTNLRTQLAGMDDVKGLKKVMRSAGAGALCRVATTVASRPFRETKMSSFFQATSCLQVHAGSIDELEKKLGQWTAPLQEADQIRDLHQACKDLCYLKSELPENALDVIEAKFKDVMLSTCENFFSSGQASMNIKLPDMQALVMSILTASGTKLFERNFLHLSKKLPKNLLQTTETWKCI